MTRRILFGVLLFQGVSGVLGGGMLFAQATGAGSWFPDEWLRDIPFTTWFWPGMILGVGLGVSALVLAFGVRRGRLWSLLGALGLGVGLMAWIVVQRQMIPGETWLQPFYFAVGAVIAGLAIAGVLSSSRRSSEKTMPTMREAAADFLACRRIAVTGVSRDPQGHGGNIVYQRLRTRGYEVFAVNPNADEVEGDRCYRDLKTIPGGVDAVVIATRPEIALDTMRECGELGMTKVWMHRAFGAGSVSTEAAEYGRAHGITVIEGGCPLMFEPTSDPAHRVLRVVCSVAGTVPRNVEGKRRRPERESNQA
jgi:uncharacterized protein